LFEPGACSCASLIKALDVKDDRHLRMEAASALGRLNAKEAFPALKAIVEDTKDDKNVRANACMGLGFMRHEGAKGVLEGALKAEDGFVVECAQAALKLLAKGLDGRILPSDPARYQKLGDAKDWGNPFLIVRANGIEIRSRETTKTVAVADLAESLRALPVEAWRLGRVVAVREIGIRSHDDDELIEQNKKKLESTLKELDVTAWWWPS
jgi:hypothetical protein